TTVLEGGCVIKNTNGSGAASTRIALLGPLDCRSSPYKPCIFTGKDDNSVGQTIPGSSGNPTLTTNGIYLNLTGNTNAIDLHHVHCRYAYYGLEDLSGPPLTVSHAEFSGNYSAFVHNSGGVWLRNVL